MVETLPALPRGTAHKYGPRHTGKRRYPLGANLACVRLSPRLPPEMTEFLQRFLVLSAACANSRQCQQPGECERQTGWFRHDTDRRVGANLRTDRVLQRIAEDVDV